MGKFKRQHRHINIVPFKTKRVIPIVDGETEDDVRFRCVDGVRPPCSHPITLPNGETTKCIHCYQWVSRCRGEGCIIIVSKYTAKYKWKGGYCVDCEDDYYTE